MEPAELTAAEKLLGAGDLAGAKAKIEAFLASDPKSFKAQGLLAMTLFKMNLFDEAIRLYEQLVHDNPTDPTLRFNLGIVCVKAERFEQAVNQLEIVLDFEPDHKKAQSYMGVALAHLGALEQAQACFIKAGNLKMAEKMEDAIRKRDAEQKAPKPGLAEPEVPPAPVPGPAQKAAPEASPSSSGPGEESSRLLTALPVPPGDEGGVILDAEPAEEEEIDISDVGTAAPRAKGAAEGAEAEQAEAFMNDVFASPEEGQQGYVTDPSATAPAQAACGSESVPLEKIEGATRFNSQKIVLDTASQRTVRFKSLVPAGDANSPYRIGAPTEIRVEESINTRIRGLLISDGSLSFRPVPKPEEGAFVLAESGRDMMLTVQGRGCLLIAPMGRVFVSIQMRDELAFFQTDWLFSYESSLKCRLNSLPVGNSKNLTFAYLQGTGHLLLALPGPLFSRTISDGICTLPRERIVGWQGSLLPQTPIFPDSTQSIADDLELVEMRGSGHVLFTLDTSLKLGGG